MKRNDAFLKDCELYKIEADDKIPDDCKCPLATTQASQNQKQTNTRSLVKLLKLKIGTKVVLTVNLDIKDRLINYQTGNISHIEFAQGLKVVFEKYM